MTGIGAFLARGWGVAIGAAAISGALTWVATADSADLGTGPARAWIDSPLDGATVADAPLSVVAHAYDPAAVDEVVLSVDGDEVQTIAPGGADHRLVSVEMTWDPPAPGVYVLQVIGRGDAGAGRAGRASVRVGDLDSPAVDAVPFVPPSAADTEVSTTTSSSTSTTSATAAPPTASTSPGATTTAPTTTGPTSTTAVPDARAPTVVATAVEVNDLMIAVTAEGTDDRLLSRIEIWWREVPIRGVPGAFTRATACDGPPPGGLQTQWDCGALYTRQSSTALLEYYALATDSAGNVGSSPTGSIAL